MAEPTPAPDKAPGRGKQDFPKGPAQWRRQAVAAREKALRDNPSPEDEVISAVLQGKKPPKTS